MRERIRTRNYNIQFINVRADKDEFPFIDTKKLFLLQPGKSTPSSESLRYIREAPSHWRHCRGVIETDFIEKRFLLIPIFSRGLLREDGS